MASILTALTDLFGTVITMLGNVVSAVTGSPILLLFAILSLVGIGVGMFHRLTRG